MTRNIQKKHGKLGRRFCFESCVGLRSTRRFLGVCITPLKINMEHNSLEVWKIIFLSKWVLCRFHVNLPGCTMFRRCLPRSFFPLLSSISWQFVLLQLLKIPKNIHEKLSDMSRKKTELQSMSVLSTCIVVLQHSKCIIYTYHTFITPWKINIEPTNHP